MQRRNSNVPMRSGQVRLHFAKAVHCVLKIISLSVLLFQSSAFAFPDIQSTSKHLQSREAPLADPVGIFGEDDRRTEEKYARENKMSLSQVQNRYAATGILTCEGSELTANLTLVNNLIVTSAHGFFNEVSCKQRSRASCAPRPNSSRHSRKSFRGVFRETS